MKFTSLIASAFRGRVPAQEGIFPIHVGALPGSTGGCVVYDPKSAAIERVGLPPGESELERTIRVHEADHIKYSPRNAREAVLIWGDEIMKHGDHMNSLEDVRISSPQVWQQRPDRVRQEALIVALHDLNESCVKMAAKETTPHEYNSAVGIAARSLALITSCRSYGDDTPEHNAMTVEANKRIKALTDAHPTVAQRLRAIRQPITWIHSCLTLSERPKTGFRESVAMRKKRVNMTHALRAYSACLMPLEFDPSAVGPVPPIPPHDGTDSDPFRDTKIIRLPLSIDTMASQKAIIRYPAMTGPRLRAGSLVQIALGIPGNHFMRRLVKPAGAGAAVMIDASGSMSLEHETLADLASQIPAGFIAYYYGCGEDEGGRIMIYADGGFRATTIPKREGGGNFCDYAAVLTLLNRPESPKILVSDLGFCGGSTSDVISAHALVERMQGSGTLTVCGTIEQALEYLAAVKP
jgi:hypothetical protein